MMASQKNNFVVNFFTLDISNLMSKSPSSNQSSFACEYEIITENSKSIEIISNNVIESKVIDITEIKEQNNTHINVNASSLASSFSPELSENDGETSGQDVTSDDDNGDFEDLTNLNWLTELKNITNLPPATNEVTEKPCDPPSKRFDKFMSQVHKIKEGFEKRSEVYRVASNEKPPYNYAQIIAMAMLDEGRMTLKQICDWIERRFAYYKVHKNWNNSIRHNLSLNFFFSKVARNKDEKGKGGYWELAVDCSKTMRKRIRQRKKKVGSLSCSKKSVKISKTKNGNKHEISKALDSKHVCSSNIGSDVFLSSPSYHDDDSNLSVGNQTIEGIEIIEEQQNINNIIDDNQHTIIITNPIFESPNVIVEAIPNYHFSQFTHIESDLQIFACQNQNHPEPFDESELSQLICMNDQELIDDFLSYNNGAEEFL